MREHGKFIFISNLPFSTPVLHLRLHTIDTMPVRNIRNPIETWLDSSVWIRKRGYTITSTLFNSPSRQKCQHTKTESTSILYLGDNALLGCVTSFCTSPYLWHSSPLETVTVSKNACTHLCHCSVLFSEMFSWVHLKGKLQATAAW